MAASTFHWIAVAFLLGFVSATLYTLRNKRTLPLPPGPPRKWFLQSNFPKGVAYMVFENWTAKYGPVFALKQGFTDVIIITRHQEAVEILERAGGVTLDRPRSIAIQETLCGEMRLLTMRSGERLRKFRRVIQNQLSLRVIQAYQPLQLRNGLNLINDILARPSEHQDHAKRFAASVTVTLTYGKASATSYSDPIVQNILFFSRRFSQAVRPNTYLIDSFPLLKYVPGYLAELKSWHTEELKYYRSLVDDFKERRAKHAPLLEPCFVGNLLDKQSEVGMSDDEIAFFAGSLFIAGADTSSSTISIMMMAAACFPEEQAAVHAQIDAVIGRNRYPTFSDEAALSVVTAFVLESFRWRPVSAGGFAHRATKDIVWQGYRIPEGATILGSHWSIAKSPDVFPEPERFNHKRWLAENGKLRDDLKSFNFGFGRRVCPGQPLAQRSMFICAALIFWAFRISPDKAKPIDTLAFTPTVNIHPLPFSLIFEPRLPSDKLAQIISEIQ